MTGNEIKRLEDCRAPEEAKRLLLAFCERKLAEGTDVPDAMLWIKEALLSGRLVFGKRRHPTPGAHPHLVAKLRQPRRKRTGP